MIEKLRDYLLGSCFTVLKDLSSDSDFDEKEYENVSYSVVCHPLGNEMGRLKLGKKLRKKIHVQEENHHVEDIQTE